MQHLRRAKNLAAFVLLWFAASLCISVASPLVSPKSLDLVCSSNGLIKLVSASADESNPPDLSMHNLDCPLCMSVVFPPLPTVGQFIPPSPLAHALQPIAAAHIAAATAPPLPSRGPPAL
jgi:hypothetical protein